VEPQVAEISHPRYLLDASVHAAGESLAISDTATRGAGAGARIATELLHGGLILGLDDNVAFGLGATWIGTSTEPHTWIEGSLEWGFWLTPDLRLAPEPGVGVSLGPGTHVRPIVRLDASYRIWDDLHVVVRVGVPVATLGVAYVK
jgi:hypothetical protein